MFGVQNKFFFHVIRVRYDVIGVYSGLLWEVVIIWIPILTGG